MEIKGQVIAVLPAQSGTSKAGKDWFKQEFVIETQETYPKKICIQATKESLCKVVSNLRIGDSLTAHINIESREYNGRWYTQINAWKIDLNQSAPSQEERQPAPLEPYKDDKSDDLPF